MYRISLAKTQAELRAAQALRYEVFVSELGGAGPLVDHEAGLEIDRFDRYFDHLLLFDDRIDAVVGVYRLLRPEMAKAAGQYYSEDEYDISPLLRSDKKLLELGRSCVRKEYRGSSAMYHLWQALARFLKEHEIEIMFGTASFHGIDTKAIAQPLSMLHHHHLAPGELRVKALSSGHQNMNLVAKEQLNMSLAKVQLPKLIRAYLRLGGVVGEGAFVDKNFNTTDVCLIMDTAKMNQRQTRFYGIE